MADRAAEVPLPECVPPLPADRGRAGVASEPVPGPGGRLCGSQPALRYRLGVEADSSGASPVGGVAAAAGGSGATLEAVRNATRPVREKLTLASRIPQGSY